MPAYVLGTEMVSKSRQALIGTGFNCMDNFNAIISVMMFSFVGNLWTIIIVIFIRLITCMILVLSIVPESP